MCGNTLLCKESTGHLFHQYCTPTILNTPVNIDAESSQCMLGMKNVRSPAFYEYNGSVICTNIRFAGLQEHDVHSTIRSPLHTVCMPEIIVQLYRDICNSVLIEFADL